MIGISLAGLLLLPAIFFITMETMMTGILLEYSGPKPGGVFRKPGFRNNVFPFRDAASHWAKDSIMFLPNILPKLSEDTRMAYLDRTIR